MGALVLLARGPVSLFLYADALSKDSGFDGKNIV